MTGIIVLILAITGEIKESGRQSGFVQSFNHKLFLFHRKPNITVLGGKRHSVFRVSGYVRALRISARNYDISAVKLTSSPFYCTRNDARAVSRFKSDAGACSRVLMPGDNHTDGNDYRQDVLFHLFLCI